MENVLDGLSSSPASPQTSLIRMQVAALLEEQSVNYEAKRRRAEPALEEVKRALLALPSREPVFAHEIEKVFAATSPHICVPFPSVRPSQVARHRYGFAPPTEVEVIGSYAVQRLLRDEPSPYIDMVVVMPEQLLEAKDYLDYRYIHKKAFYLACIADGLRSALRESFDMAFGYQNGNELQACLKLTPTSESSERSRRWNRIRILVGAPATMFRPEKLRPWASCLRHSSYQGMQPQPEMSPACPFYNGTIVSERLFGTYLALQQHTALQFPGFPNACMLGKIWLRQRGFSSEVLSGGFGAFEFSAILALFLRRNHNVKIALPASASDGFQLFRSLVQVLASRDTVSEPLIFGIPSDGVSSRSDERFPLVYDREREHNLAFKMSVSSAELLRAEARATASALAQSGPYQFYPTFIARLGSDIARFDYVLNGTILLQPGTILQTTNKLHETLMLALRDRASLVHINIENEDTPETWPCSSSPPEQGMRRKLRIGIFANPAQIARRVDLGPLAEETEAAETYRAFWGPKAELRRFANGEIRESVTWPAPRSDVDTLNFITSHTVARHFSKGLMTISESIGDDFASMLHTPVPTSQALSIFSSVEEAFSRLQESLRAVSGHPLRLRQISASAPGLRYASMNQPNSQRLMEPLDVVVQFEGSVRWPEDVIAVQHTKTALLSKIAEMLEGEDHVSNATVGLEDVRTDFASRAFLDLQIGQVSFRLRIHHDGEPTLLTRLIKDASLSSKDRALAAAALSEHKRIYVHGPRHTQAIREFCTRVPLLSPTIRLFKRWVSSHLLLPHFRDELLELITIHTFDRPFPYASPGSLRTAFLRTLLFLSRWDWQNEPLILSLTTSALNRSDIDNIATNFQAWRQIDPAMQRVALFVASDIDHDGTTWSSQSPSIVAVNRLTSLARAACGEVLQYSATPRPQPLFVSSLEEFDFVLHLNQAPFQQPPRKRAASNGTTSTRKPASGGDIDRICRSFVLELERIFAGYVAFFHNNGSLPVIAGVWAPRDSMRGLKLGASWMTIPKEDGQELEASVTPNKCEVLHQIASLGGDLVSSIEVRAEIRD